MAYPVERKLPEERPEPHPVRESPEEERRSTSRTRNIAIAVVVVIAILLFLLVRHRAAANAKAKDQQAGAAGGKGRPVPVSVAAAQLANVPVFFDGLGNVNALNTVTVKTRIDGQLVRFNFQEGQIVQAVQEIALIDPRPAESALAQAQATKFKDVATLENARRDLERYADLYKSGVMSQQQYNTQQSAVQVSEGTVKADDAQIQNAQLNVTYCHIKSPITGRVGIRFVDPGNMVHASDQNGLVVITQMQPIAVLFTLPEDQLQPVLQHARVHPLQVEAWSRDNTQRIAVGRLLTTDNEIDPNTGTFRAKAIFDNTDGALFPNQFVNARLQVDTRVGATVVPSAAVQHGAQGTYVYVVAPDKTADMRTVNVTLTEGTMSVVDGVNPGEQVVTDGADKLQPHGKVEIGGQGGGRGGHRGGGSGQPQT